MWVWMLLKGTQSTRLSKTRLISNQSTGLKIAYKGPLSDHVISCVGDHQHEEVKLLLVLLGSLGRKEMQSRGGAMCK